VDLQRRFIGSPGILTNVIVKLRLDEKLARQNGGTRWSINDTYEYLGNQISVEQTRMTRLLEVSVRNPNPELAANIANATVESYQQFTLESSKKIRELQLKSLWLHLHRSYEFHPPRRFLDQLGQPATEKVIMCNPATPSLNSVVPTKGKIFLTWICEGTLLALLAGGGALFVRQSNAR